MRGCTAERAVLLRLETGSDPTDELIWLIIDANPLIGVGQSRKVLSRVLIHLADNRLRRYSLAAVLHCRLNESRWTFDSWRTCLERICPILLLGRQDFDGNMSQILMDWILLKQCILWRRAERGLSYFLHDGEIISTRMDQALVVHGLGIVLLIFFGFNELLTWMDSWWLWKFFSLGGVSKGLNDRAGGWC